MDSTDLTWVSRAPGHLPIPCAQEVRKDGSGPRHVAWAWSLPQPFILIFPPTWPRGYRSLPEARYCPQPAMPQWPRAGDLPPLLQYHELLWESEEWGAHPHSSHHPDIRLNETPSWAHAPSGLRRPALLRVHVAVPEEAAFWMTHSGHTLLTALVTWLQPGR